MYKINKKVNTSFVFIIFVFGLVFPQIVGATIYQPGATLEPDCAPGSVNCGVASISPTNNLSDLTSITIARTNLGLGTLSTQNGTFSGTSSGTNTGDQTTISGNAGTATALQTARTINGVSFDGTANITISAAADAGLLTGVTLAPTVVNSSLTSVGTLTNLTVTNPITGSVTGNAGTATALQTARTINGVSFDGTANITISAAADAGLLTGVTLAPTIINSSLTSVGPLTNLTVVNPIVGSILGSSGSTTGNAGTATALQTARNINGVSFNGTADITVAAAAGTLTGTTLAANVVNSSLTSVGTLTNLTVTNPITGSITGSSGSTTGNAGTATALQTPRNINGVSFNGTADITVAAAAGTLTGATLAANVLNSSLTSVGTLTNLTVTNPITGSITGSAGTVTTNANLTGAITSVGNATSLGSFTSANLSGALTDETGTGIAVFATSPTLVTPTLGVATATSITGASTLTLNSTGANAITLDSTTTGAVNIGTGNNSKTIRIGSTGTPSNTIVIGNTNSTFSINSNGLNVTTGGALTGVSSIDTIAYTGSGITFAGTGNIQSTGANPLTLDSTTTGDVNLGTGTTGAGKIINVGNTNGTTQLNLNAGTNGMFLAGAATASAGHVSLCIDSGTNQLFLGATDATCNPSSSQYKHDIAGIGLGLDAVNAMRPVSYVYNSNNQATLGFIAEEAAQVDERLIARDKNGVIQAINPNAFTPILTRAIQQVSALIGDVSANDTNGLSSLVATVQSESAPSPIAIITQKINDGKRFLTDFVTARVTAIRGYFDEIFSNKSHQETLCIGDINNGGETCITKTQLDQLLQNQNSGSSVPPTSTPDETPDPVPASTPDPQPESGQLSAETPDPTPVVDEQPASPVSPEVAQ